MAITFIRKAVPTIAAVPVLLSGEYVNPLLAGEGVLGQISYPKVAMPKHNGVRGFNQQGNLLARSLKPIKNKYCSKTFAGLSLSGVEGELVVGEYNDEEVFVNSQSGVNTIEGIPDVMWYAFDIYHPTKTFMERLALRDQVVKAANNPRVQLIPWIIVYNDKEMDVYAKKCLLLGYEGIVLKDPNAKYKTGRSSDKEGIFLRYCPWFKSEARIIGIEEGEVNNNESVINELGYKKKSSHKENKVGSGRGGRVHVMDIKSKTHFRMPIPSVALQEAMWAHPEQYKGKIVHYKFKPPVKRDGKPRFPQLDKEAIFEGFRDPDDMS